MQQSELSGDLKVSTYVLGQATAGNADDWPLLQADRPIKITGVRWIPAAAVTGANTNNFALQAINKGTGGAGTTGVTTTKTYASGTNSVAHDSEDLTLSSTATDLQLAAGEVLSLVRTVNGTGLAMPDGLVEVRYQHR